jgi:hypothetical protein
MAGGALLMLALAHFALGCGKAMGVLVAKTVGEDIHAVYVPVKTDPMLVLAENYQNPGANALESEQLARYVGQNLERKKVAPLINPTLAIDLRSKDPDAYRKMTITQIGQALGARQVLYIALLSDDLDTSQGSDYRRAEASARVRIIDVKTGQTRWPVQASAGYPVSTRTPVVKVANDDDEASLRRSAQARLGGDIARLFYKYKADEEGEKALGP